MSPVRTLLLTHEFCPVKQKPIFLSFTKELFSIMVLQNYCLLKKSSIPYILKGVWTQTPKAILPGSILGSVGHFAIQQTMWLFEFPPRLSKKLTYIFHLLFICVTFTSSTCLFIWDLTPKSLCFAFTFTGSEHCWRIKNILKYSFKSFLLAKCLSGSETLSCKADNLGSRGDEGYPQTCSTRSMP